MKMLLENHPKCLSHFAKKKCILQEQLNFQPTKRSKLHLHPNIFVYLILKHCVRGNDDKAADSDAMKGERQPSSCHVNCQFKLGHHFAYLAFTTASTWHAVSESCGISMDGWTSIHLKCWNFKICVFDDSDFQTPFQNIVRLRLIYISLWKFQRG